MLGSGLYDPKIKLFETTLPHFNENDRFDQHNKKNIDKDPYISERVGFISKGHLYNLYI